MKRRTIAILLAAVLVAGGLGGFAYANNNLHEPMTGQKLVGYGFYGEHYIAELGGTLQLHTMFVFTNPDCVSKITIDRVFIFAYDGTILHEMAPSGDDASLEPHEVDGVELHDYIDLQDLLMPVTVEIFWTCSHKNGLPLTGWTQTGYYTVDDENLVEGSVGETQMVNMNQVLTPVKEEKPK